MARKLKLIKNILAKKLVNGCRTRKYKIGIAESCTGGLISSSIVSVPGSSDIFEFSLITYSNASKKKFLNVAKKTIDNFGAVSEEVVTEMLQGLKKNKNLDIFLAISGIAGPSGGTKKKPIGLVWIAYSLKNEIIKTKKYNFGNVGREKIRIKSAEKSFNLLLSLLGG